MTGVVGSFFIEQLSVTEAAAKVFFSTGLVVNPEEFHVRNTPNPMLDVIPNYPQIVNF